VERNLPFPGKEPVLFWLHWWDWGPRLTDMRSDPSEWQAAPNEAGIVTRATVRTADRLDIKNTALARILGLSEATISRMRKGKFELPKTQKAFELAVLFIRLYRSLDGIVGGDDRVASDWLKNENTVLGATPLELMQSVSGLSNVIAYLDSRRAIV
jgi:transcriptional regulator with XRE-family HTH domain